MKKLLDYYRKYYSILVYIFFGVLTTYVNFTIYILFSKIFLINIILSNITAWFGAVIFAFFTNRKFVFKSEASYYQHILKEFILFVLSRVLSGGLETLMLYIMVNCLNMNDLIVKVIAAVIVIIFNYVFSKFIIFNKDK